jgi:hypothetical protein
MVSASSCTELLQTLKLSLSLGKVGCKCTIALNTANTTIYEAN